jgi:hypothetical protein
MNLHRSATNVSMLSAGIACVPVGRLYKLLIIEARGELGGRMLSAAFGACEPRWIAYVTNFWIRDTIS